MNYFSKNKQIIITILLASSILNSINDSLANSTSTKHVQNERTQQPLKAKLNLKEYINLEKYVYEYIHNNKNFIKPEKNESGFFRINIQAPEFINKDLGIEKLRLHYWPLDDSNTIQKETIHDHPKYFESFILSGGYIHSIYSMYKYNINKAEKCQLFKINKENDLKTAVPVGAMFISKDKDETVKEGNIVVMTPDIIHRVLYSVPGSLTLNVVYKDIHNKDYYNIMLTEKATKEDIITSRRVIDGKMKDKILNEIEKRLLNSLFQSGHKIYDTL